MSVVLSPSKVIDFGYFLTRSPDYPLPLDILVDLILFEKPILLHEATSRLITPQLIETGAWKNAFEDLINMGAFEVDVSYASRDEEIRLLRATHLHANTKADLAELTVALVKARQLGRPLLYRNSDIPFYRDATREAENLADASLADAPVYPEDEPDLRHAANVFLSVRIPSIFAKPAKGTNPIEPLSGLRTEDVVWLDPNDLVTIMKDQRGLAQLRTKLKELAADAPSRPQFQARLAAQERKLKNELSVAGLQFDALGFALSAIPIPLFSDFVSKAVEIGATRYIESDFRWLLMTEHIEANLFDES